MVELPEPMANHFQLGLGPSVLIHGPYILQSAF